VQVIFDPRPEYLRVVVRRRESVEEIKATLPAIVEQARTHGLRRLLLVSEESPPVFRVQQFDLDGWLERLVEHKVEKVALVSDSAEVFASHQYIELLARQRGAPLRAFREEKSAVEWLLV
jgi:hypothetical protein